MRSLAKAADEGAAPVVRRPCQSKTGAIVLIGHSHRRHFVFGSCPGQRVVIAGSIEKTETRMQMEMNER